VPGALKVDGDRRRLAVVDFVNEEAAVREAFARFAGEATCSAD
jgi:hypothetical protein